MLLFPPAKLVQVWLNEYKKMFSDNYLISRQFGMSLLFAYGKYELVKFLKVKDYVKKLQTRDNNTLKPS